MADHTDKEFDSFAEANGEAPSAASALAGTSFSAPRAGQAFRLSFWAKAAALAAIVALAVAGHLTSSLRHNAEAPKAKTVELDPAEIAARETVPTFRLLAADGKATGFDAFGGQVVILSFWASWCAPCLVEMPTFVEVERKFHERGLRVVAVNVDEDAAGRGSAKDFWKSKAFAFPTFFDLDRKLQGQFHVEMLPSNIVFDRAGRVAFKGFGANDWANPQTQDLLEQLLQEPAGAAPPPAAPAQGS